MAWQNNLREIRIILYRLKRSYGLPATIRRPRSTSQDILTGDITQVYDEYLIKRVIILPSRNMRDFIYDLSYIAANKNFTYGGFFDSRSRWMIIDIKDCPRGFTLTENCNIVFETRQYEIKEFTLAEHNQGWLIHAYSLDSSDSVTSGSSG